MTKRAVKLGDAQKTMLEHLLRSGSKVWFPGCGYLWTSRSATLRIFESLAKRGLVEAKSSTRFELTDCEAAFQALHGHEDATYQKILRVRYKLTEEK